MLRDQVAVHNVQVMGGIHLHVCPCARADVIPFPYLVNGWTDCAEIWYVVRGPLARRLTKIYGGAHLHLRTCARADVPPFPHLGNGWTDCAKIWYVVGGPLTKRFPKLILGTCARAHPFSVSVL